jgi:predicted RNA-binding Zn ribbon-like protein
MTSYDHTPVMLTCQGASLVTNIECVSTLPSWYPWPETKPAPPPLLLVQAFVNTLEIEKQVDMFDDADAARAWLIDAGMLGATAQLSAYDLAQARAVRECIRELLTRSDPQPSIDPLRDLAASGSVHLTIADDGQTGLESPEPGELADGLLGLLMIIHRAQQDGTWSRLRICANHECRWAFYDRSRNQHGSWCDMAACGNRLKNRELRARRRN